MKKSCLSGVFCLVLFCLGLAESSGVTADIVQNPDNGHFYELVLAPGISWDQANEEANTRPGNWHLATITDSAENAFIKSLLAPGEPFFTADSDCGFAGGFIGRICGGIWLGATRASGTSNSWTWVTGEIWSFTDWGPLEPIDSTLLSLDEFRDIGPILAWNDKSPQSAPATGYIVETDVAAFISIIEAESMALSGGYAVEANAAASGGQLIRRLASGGYAATASTEYTGAAGNYDIAVSYFDENDGMSNLAFLLNGQMLDEWVADEDPVCSDCASPGANTLRTRVVARGMRLLPGDEITLQGTGEHYEYARFDKLTVSPTGSSTYEAERMALKGGYAVEANAAASGGQLIRRLASGGYAATASTEYTGAAGNYDIAVSYFDENDGMSNLAFLLNGQMLDEWVADEDPVCSDCASPGANTLRTRVVARGMRLLPGDEITLQGTGEHYEYARFDELTVSPAGSSTYEAEKMALNGGYAVEDNAAASGGQLIRRLASGGYAATASTEYTGAAGTYEVTVSYFDESDGVSSLAFLVNGEILDQWLAEEDPVCSDCDSPGASTLRTRVVASELGLQPGDEITLQGTGEHYEYARFDKLTVSPTVVGPVVFNDGGSYLIDYNISTGLRVENATSVSIASGVTISGPEAIVVALSGGSSVRVNGGYIQGAIAGGSGSNIILNAGFIDRVYMDEAFGPGLTITGGRLNDFHAYFSWVTMSGGELGTAVIYDGDARVSGGVIGSMTFESATSFGITGGRFEDKLRVDHYAGGAISGGYFPSTIEVFGGDSFLGLLGDLTLGDPVAIGQYLYTRRVSGTLRDGKPIDADIECYLDEHMPDFSSCLRISVGP